MPFRDPGPLVMARALADKLEEEFSDALDEVAARFTCSCPDGRHEATEWTWREYIDGLRWFSGNMQRADRKFVQMFMAQIQPVMQMAQKLNQDPLDVLAMETFRYDDPQ